MIPKSLLALLAGLLLGACSESSSPEKVVGGGFETSDLQVVAVDTGSNVLAGARIWILDPAIDSTSVPPALDSARSDTQGRTVFRLADSGRARIGIEAWSGDSLVGILRAVDLVPGRPVRIVLKRARQLQIPCSTSIPGGVLYLRGSHLPIAPPAVCVDSFVVRVPPGPSNLFAPGGPGGGPWILPFQGDTLPPWPYMPGGGEPPPPDPVPGTSEASPKPPAAT